MLGTAIVPVAKVGFHIPSLDGLRTLSFAVVFAAHAGLYYVVPGGFGVTVFFFLSGFLITTLLRLEFDKTGSVSLRKFYVRRALRILPPFYLVLFVASALVALGAVAGPVEPRAVLAQSLHYANYFIIGHGSGGFAPGTAVYWSLAVEEHFYLLFPLLYLSLRKRGVSAAGQALTLGALCVVILGWRCLLVYGLHSSVDRTYVASDTRFDSILFGCMLAVFGNPMLDTPRIGDRVWKAVLLPLGVLGLLASFLIATADFAKACATRCRGWRSSPCSCVPCASLPGA